MTSFLKDSGSFLDTLKAAPTKVSHYIDKEIHAVRDNPARWARNGYVRNGRGLAGMLWLAGDVMLPASPKSGLLLKMAGIVGAPGTVSMLLEPLLGRKFGRDEETQQPIVPIGNYKFNTTKFGYRMVGTSCVFIALDGISKLPQHPVPAIIQIAATSIAAYGSFQAARKNTTQSKTKSEKPSIFRRFVDRVPEKSFIGRLVRDNEFSGVGKLILENIPMICSAVATKDWNLARSYLFWTGGNVTLATRRAIELFHQNKNDITQPMQAMPGKAVVPSLDKPG